MIDIQPVLASLSARRPIFHSEADLQHELAHELRAHDPGLALRLEYPIGTAKRASLDILLRKGGARFGIELKYLCRSADVTFDEERFALKHQSAHDIRRYDVVKDITRMERFTERFGAEAAVLVLSNDPAYWSSRRRLGTIDAAFDLCDLGRLTGTLGWATGAGAGTMKGRTDPLIVSGSYDLRWHDYSDLGGHGGRFRYLYVPIARPTAARADPPVKTG
ncbi:MAG TPA: hypothetical protein VF582_02500 [Allosphingosinicella sp.]|jgi:hypothetical protein